MEKAAVTSPPAVSRGTNPSARAQHLQFHCPGEKALQQEAWHLGLTVLLYHNPHSPWGLCDSRSARCGVLLPSGCGHHGQDTWPRHLEWQCNLLGGADHSMWSWDGRGSRQKAWRPSCHMCYQLTQSLSGSRGFINAASLEKLYSHLTPSRKECDELEKEIVRKSIMHSHEVWCERNWWSD